MLKSLKRFHRSIKEIEPYIGIFVLGGGVAVVSKFSSLFGELNWADAVLIGIVVALLIMLIVSVALAGWRFFNPLPINVSDQKTAIEKHSDQLTLLHDLINEKEEKFDEELEKYQGPMSDQLDNISTLLKRLSEILEAREKIQQLDEITKLETLHGTPIEDYDPKTFVDDDPNEEIDLANHRIEENIKAIEGILGDEKWITISNTLQEVTKEVESDERQSNMLANERHHWRSSQEKQFWHVANAKIKELNRFISKEKRHLQSKAGRQVSPILVEARKKGMDI